MLLKGLKTETNPQNTEMLLWLLLTHLYETIDDNSDFAHLMIDTILSKIKSMALWPYKVTLTAFKVLSTMTQFYNKIPNNNEVKIKETFFFYCFFSKGSYFCCFNSS